MYTLERMIRFMKILARLTMFGLTCALLAGCQTPEERVVNQMQKMQKAMDEMEKRLDAMDADMKAKLK